MQIKKGKLIQIVGIDGSGKTTAVEMAKEILINEGRDFRVINILKDDPVSAQIRAIVTDSGNEIYPESEACLYAAAVMNTYHLRIKPLLDQGIDVICDRSHVCTMAYQAATQELLGNPKPKQLLKAAYEGQNAVEVDALIVLYIDPETGLERVKSRDGKLDRIEQRGPEYINQVQNAYEDYIDALPHHDNVYEYINHLSIADLQYFVSNAIHHALEN